MNGATGAAPNGLRCAIFAVREGDVGMKSLSLLSATSRDFALLLLERCCLVLTILFIICNASRQLLDELLATCPRRPFTHKTRGPSKVLESLPTGWSVHFFHIPKPLFFALDSSLPNRFQPSSFIAQPLAMTHCQDESSGWGVRLSGARRDDRYDAITYGVERFLHVSGARLARISACTW